MKIPDDYTIEEYRANYDPTYEHFILPMKMGGKELICNVCALSTSMVAAEASDIGVPLSVLRTLKPSDACPRCAPSGRMVVAYSSEGRVLTWREFQQLEIAFSSRPKACTATTTRGSRCKMAPVSSALCNRPDIYDGRLHDECFIHSYRFPNYQALSNWIKEQPNPLGMF